MIKQKLILDGGMGRELERVGAPFKQPEWSALALIEAPDYVRQVHDSYIQAGADVITTNAYAVVPFHIGEERFAQDGRRLIALAGELARNAADAVTDRKVLVAGCLPPVFGSYQPELFDAQKAGHYFDVLISEQQPYVDFWLAETQSSLAEVEAVHKAVLPTGKPLWVSFTLTDNIAPEKMSEPKIRSGETVAAAAALAAKIGAQALLFNCSTPEAMDAAIKVARAEFDRLQKDIRIGVYANAFPSQQEDMTANESITPIREDLSPDAYGEWSKVWAASGATIIGGCCGIGCEHIQQLSDKYLCW